MKITQVERSISYVVETDEPHFPTFRRHSSECWEQLMGESWESVYNDRLLDDLEEAFQVHCMANFAKEHK